MLAERETYESDDEEQAATNNTKQEISIGKINIDYEAIIAKKTAQEKENLSSGMKVCSRCWKFCYQIQDKMADFRKLRQMSKKYAEEDFKEREQIARTLQARAVSCKLERSQPKIHSLAQMTTYYWYVISKLQPSKDSSIVQEIGRIDATKRNLDSEFAAREKEMAEKLALEKVEKLCTPKNSRAILCKKKLSQKNLESTWDFSKKKLEKFCPFEAIFLRKVWIENEKFKHLFFKFVWKLAYEAKKLLSRKKPY